MNIWTHFFTNDYSKALILDSLQKSHPIEIPIKSPTQIDQIFDEITYYKGACVIRMLHTFIGDEVIFSIFNLINNIRNLFFF